MNISFCANSLSNINGIFKPEPKKEKTEHGRYIGQYTFLDSKGEEAFTTDVFISNSPTCTHIDADGTTTITRYGRMSFYKDNAEILMADISEDDALKGEIKPCSYGIGAHAQFFDEDGKIAKELDKLPQGCPAAALDAFHNIMECLLGNNQGTEQKSLDGGLDLLG